MVTDREVPNVGTFMKMATFLLTQLFGLVLYLQVNSYGHVRTVSYLTTLFSSASLTKQLTILSLVTDNIPS